MERQPTIAELWDAARIAEQSRKEREALANNTSNGSGHYVGLDRTDYDDETQHKPTDNND